MTNIDRLLTRINAVLDGDAEGFEARSLASEYAALAESVGERLHRCAALVAAGNDHAALQLAETDPPVLDLAAKLAFARAGRWRDYCRTHRFPVPPRIEDRLVETTNGLYSREIGESHPLYRDYRSAMRERDDRRALGVLRSIARINATDRNARDEYARLSAKLRREYLAKLDGTLAAGDTAGTLALMTAMESAGLDPVAGDPVWRRAADIRENAERENALAQALALVPKIAARRDDGDAEGAIPLLGRARSLEKQYGFVWPETEGRLVAETERLMAALADEAEAKRLADERRAELLSRLDALEDEASDASRAVGPRAETLKRLRTWLTEAAGERHFPEDDLRRGEILATTLSDDISRTKTRRLLTLAALLAAAAGAATFGAMKVASLGEARAFADALALAEKSDAATPLFDFSENVVRKNPGLAASPEYKPRVNALTTRAAELRRDIAQIAEEIESLKTAPRAESRPVRASRERLAALDAATNALPDDLKRRFGPEVAAIGRTIDARAIDAPAAIVEAGTPKDDAPFTPEPAWLAALAELDTALKSPGTAPAESVERGKAILEAAGKHVSETQAKAALDAAVKAALEAVATARDIDDYMKAVSALADAAPGSAESADAAKIVAASETLKKLPGALLPPETLAMKEALDAGAHAPFLPDDTTASESANAGKFAALAKFAGTLRATRVTYTPGGGAIETPVLLAAAPKTERTELNGGVEIRMSARVLHAVGSPESVDTKLIRFDGRKPSGEIFADIAPAPEGPLTESLAKSYDAARGAFTEPPLALLDRTLASEASPLFKAWVHRQIAEIAAERPGLMGVAFSPEFAADSGKLSAITPAPIPREAWLSPAKFADLTGKLAAFYAKKRAPYAPAAAARAATVAKIFAGGATFAGHVGPDGVPVLADGASDGDRLYGLAGDGSAAVLVQVGNAEAEGLKKPAPFSPLLRWTVSPEKAGPEGVSLFVPKP